MVIVCLTSLIALLFSYLEDKGQKNGLKIAFFLITAVAAIHYNYGNDYKYYKELFDELTRLSYNWDNIVNTYLHTNIGWTLVNILFKPFGFYFMVATIAIFQNCVIYRFVKNYVDRGYYTFALFIYLFNTNFYLLSFSMMRQSLAIIFVLCAILRLLKKKYVQTLLLMLIAISMHSSAVIILPFLLIQLIPINNGKIWSVVILALSFGMFLFKDFANYFYLLMADSEDVSKTLDYYSGEAFSVSYGLGFWGNILPYVVSLWYIAKKWSKENNVYRERNYLTILASFGLLIVPFAQIIQLLSRLSYYFNILTISTIPFTYNAINNKGVKLFATLLFVMLTVYGYWNFFMSPGSSYALYYKDFHSIFELL